MISIKGVLSEFLEKHRAEVIDVCITEYNEELHERTLKEEVKLEGKLEAETKAAEDRLKIISNMIATGTDKSYILKVG